MYCSSTEKFLLMKVIYPTSVQWAPVPIKRRCIKTTEHSDAIATSEGSVRKLFLVTQPVQKCLVGLYDALWGDRKAYGY